MSVFTEMEESIMDCWTIVEDLKALADSEPTELVVTSELLKAFATVYSFKFSRLADLHEDALKEYYTLKWDSTEELIDEVGAVQW